MLKLLVHLENKILLSKKRDVLIFCDCDFKNISEWLNTNYDVKVIKIDMTVVENIVIVYATKNEYFDGRTVSISKAISLLDSTETELEKYLCDLKMSGAIKLQYGLKDGRIVHISEILESERGLRCECYCPGCGEKLQARLGKKKQKHFSHYGEHCNIEVAQQTALHIMAKEIIEEELSLFIPGIKFNREEIYKDRCDAIFWELPKEYKYKHGGIVKFDSVELEKRISGIIPDIIVYKNGRPCLIEIAVTHFVDDEKLLKVKQLQIPMLEIDVSSLYGNAYSKDKLREAIIYQSDNRKWVYNPQCERARVEAEEYYSKKYVELEFEELRKEEAELRKELKRKEIVQRAQVKISDLITPENYKNKLFSLRDDNAFYDFYKTLYFYKEAKEEHPFFIDLPVKGEMIFNCDRRIWQGAIFDRFVYCCRSTNGKKPIISYKKIKNWIKENQKTITINQEINRKVEIDGTAHVFLYEAIIQYLRYLSYIGFTYDLKNKKPMYMVEESGSIIPPQKERAETLKRAFSSADLYSPNINDEIENMLYHGKSFEINIEPVVIKARRFSAYNSVIDREQYLLEEKNKLTKGFETVKEMDFSLETQIYDEYGTRWVKCSLCGKIKPSNKMWSCKYGVGQCSKCGEDAF